MRKLPRGYVYGFYDLRQSWHAKTPMSPEVSDEVTFGIFIPDRLREPRQTCGFAGELRVRWYRPGPRLNVFSDSWATLAAMPEVLEAMAAGSPDIDCAAFTQMLRGLGFRDLTQREEP